MCRNETKDETRDDSQYRSHLAREYITRQDRLPRSREHLPNAYESKAYKVRALPNVIANAQKACYAFYCIMKCFRKPAAQHSQQPKNLILT
jgi:hypothetical protein